MKQGHDYFGFSLWHELLAGNADWIASLKLGDPRGFDPEEDGWTHVFSRLERVHAGSGLADDLGACFHVSSDFAAMLVDPGFSLLAPFKKARNVFTEKIPFELGMHCTFGGADLPLAGNYPAVLKRDLELASAIDACCIVCHAPKGIENHMASFVEELTSKSVIDTLTSSKPDIVFAWENSGPDSFFGSLKHLLDFRALLSDKLAAMGQQKLMNRHVFCLDTGHLLIWRENAQIGKRAASREIEQYLPLFARDIKVFHIHANDGKSDQHLTPGSLDHFDHPTRKAVDKKRFLSCSNDVLGFLETCEQYKGMAGRHVHVEALRLPITLGQLAGFGQAYAKLIKNGENDEQMNFSDKVDQKVTITGKISNIPWQHMITTVKGYPLSEYFDLDDKTQIVIYLKTAIPERGHVAITGKVIGVKGGSKRPGAAKSEPFTEYQVAVDEWKPVK